MLEHNENYLIKPITVAEKQYKAKYNIIQGKTMVINVDQVRIEFSQSH